MAVAARNSLESILRKWVYSFKHSGNSRGQHRGPENMYVFWQSGLKMSEFSGLSWRVANFLKRDFLGFDSQVWACSILLPSEQFQRRLCRSLRKAPSFPPLCLGRLFPWLLEAQRPSTR